MAQGDYIDPALRQAVTNQAAAVLTQDTDPVKAQASGLLKYEEPPKFSAGSALNEAVLKRAREKFNDPTISQGMQDLRFVKNQAQKLQNASNKLLNVYKLDKQAEEIIRQRRAAEESQRASVLSSVLGLGGAVAGAAVGGPAGAVVGSQVGSAGAQMAGGGSQGAKMA